MVRMKEGNFIAIHRQRMIEVVADDYKDALHKATKYFKSREHKNIGILEITICQIPTIIRVLEE